MRVSSLVDALISAAAILASVMLASCSDTPDSSPVAPPAKPDTTTTTDDFVWTRVQIGKRPTGIYGICALSDTSVWMAGDILFGKEGTRDSNNVLITPFQLARWNGRELEYMKVRWYEGGPLGVGEAQGVIALSDSDLWIGRNGDLTHWAHGKFTTWPVPEMVSGTDMIGMVMAAGRLYLYGYGGVILLVDAWPWKRIETGTSSIISDAWTAGSETIFLESNWRKGYERPRLLALENGSLRARPDSGIAPGMSSLWFDGKGAYFLTGNVTRHWTGARWEAMYNPGAKWSYTIRGVAWNDVFMADELGGVHHFNGKRWISLPEVDPAKVILFKKIAYIKDNVFILGFDDKGAFFMYHGKRRS